MKPQSEAPVLVLGGAGFVGCNLVNRLVADGHRVRLFDNLSRAGVNSNLAWLTEQHGDRVEVVIGDIRDRKKLEPAIAGASAVFHLAAQVAVTTSVVDPAHDFSVNLAGTLEVLHCLRALKAPPPLVFTSTNKVYGGLHDLALAESETRWWPADPRMAEQGIDEDRPLAFCSPYGCSKGAADQYVIDHANTYGLPTTVLRMSCIYGPHQMGTEDQGWVAHFLLQAIAGNSITIYGDGKQVRDILFVDDLVDAMLLSWQHIGSLSGRAFNMGGGPKSSVSLKELLQQIQALVGARPDVDFAPWRVSDQRYYVSNTRAFSEVTGWSPKVDVQAGVAALHRWLVEHHASKAKNKAAGALSAAP